MNISALHHDTDARQFYLLVDDGRAFIDYVRDGDEYRLVHSEVPPSLRGQGIGKRLVERTFEAIEQEHCTARAICSYIKLIAQRHPRWRDVVSC